MTVRRSNLVCSGTECRVEVNMINYKKKSRSSVNTKSDPGQSHFEPDADLHDEERFYFLVKKIFKRQIS